MHIKYKLKYLNCSKIIALRFSTECRVQNHIPTCTCLPRYTGDPFIQCVEIIEQPSPKPYNPCDPSPCGPNALCDNAVCTCVKDYFGDPYIGCRPECTLNTECSPNKACINNRCIDPCIGTCGSQAICSVTNHIPSCTCPEGYEGDAFISCRPIVVRDEVNPCSPSPCGPNSMCRISNGGAICGCLPNMIGSPPQCRPECTVSAECALQQACLNQKCRDPCPGVCGSNASK